MQVWSRTSRFTQVVPAGFPPGIPGIELDIDGAIQQAPHPFLQFIVSRSMLQTSFRIYHAPYRSFS
jgi:hypothetical protein